VVSPIEGGAVEAGGSERDDTGNSKDLVAAVGSIDHVGANGAWPKDAGDPRHALRGDLDPADHNILEAVVPHGQIFLNRVLDILERLLLGGALRPAAWQGRNRDAEPSFGLHQRDLVLHQEPPARILPFLPTNQEHGLSSEGRETKHTGESG